MDTIHDTDLLYFFTERIPDHVYATGYKSGNMELSSDPNFLDIIYRYDKGNFGATAHFDYVVHPQVHDLTIVGDKGYVAGDFMSSDINVGNIDGTMETSRCLRDFDNVYRAEWQSFIESISGEHKPENSAESAIVATLLLQCQIDSAKSGKEVDVAIVAENAGFAF